MSSEKKLQFKKLIGFKMMNGKKFCITFEFNTNTTIMFVGSSEGQIKVFGFNNNNKLISTFHNNKVKIKCLAWIKKTNSLVSEGEGYSIHIWQNYWNTFQKLQGHFQSISALIINQTEDLLITGSEDGTIRFWKNIDQIWNYQQTVDVEYILSSLNINKLETQLISCARYSKISVIEYKSNQQWSIIYNIEIQDCCKDLLFVNQNSFVFQPSKMGYLEIFNYSLETQQYIKRKRIQINERPDYYDGLKCQFIEEKNLLIVKHDCSVIIFLINQQGEFILQQKIEFYTYFINGKLTNNGQCLALWNGLNYQIQFWRFQDQKSSIQNFYKATLIFYSFLSFKKYLSTLNS